MEVVVEILLSDVFLKNCTSTLTSKQKKGSLASSSSTFVTAWLTEHVG